MIFSVLPKARRALAPIAYLLLIAVAPAQINIAFAEDAPWQLEKQKNDIGVYTRRVEDSPYLAVKGMVQLNVPMTQMPQLLGDGNGCSPWRAMCKSSQVIETVSEDDRYIYMVLDMPWPASDRDMVFHTTTSVDLESKTTMVNLQSASARHPLQNNVRAESYGKFIIQAVDQNKVEFTYIMHTDLGGDLPANLVNQQLVESTFDDLTRLKQLTWVEGTDHD
jgi:hypothetical protein